MTFSLRDTLNTKLGAYRKIRELLLAYPGLLVALVLSAFFTALSEGLGVSLVIPLLQDAQGSATALNDVPLLGLFGQWVQGLSLVARVRWVAVFLLGLALVRGGFTFANQLVTYLFQIRVEKALKEQVFKQCLDVDLHFIHQKRGGDLITLLSTFTYQAGAIVQTAASAFTHLFTIAIYTVLMVLLSWQLTLVSVVLLALASGVIKKKLSNRIHHAGQAYNAAAMALNSLGLESVAGMKLIRLFNREHFVLERFKRGLETYQEQLFQRSRLISLINPLFSTLNALVLALLLVASTVFLPIETGAGMLLLFLIIMYRLMIPATTLNGMRGAIVSMFPNLESTHAFLDRRDKPYLSDGTHAFQTLNERVSFEHVTFRYEAHEPPVLEDVSFDIPKGKMVAIVGPSGSGKTTVVNLIARLYDVGQGRITLDGTDLRQVKLSSWRAQLAVVSQETFIFNDTVAANLRFAKQGASEAQLHHAARLANAHAFIAALPQGYDTVLGDRGVRLSGGQQQRLAIARAILADPQLLVLDEATSSLDSETEQLIQQAIERVSQERTVLAIAHRLSTVRKADNIVVLDQGKVVEQGTHQELMQQHGRYWKLVQLQNFEVERPVQAECCSSNKVPRRKRTGYF